MELFGGIEAGGTKFVCAVGTGPEDIVDEIRFPTTTPEETIGTAIDFFRGAVAKGATLRAVGIASFGPVDPNPASPTFGYVTSTPKPGWANTDFAGPVRAALGAPVGFDTDVNGAAQGLATFVFYLSVGTGSSSDCAWRASWPYSRKLSCWMNPPPASIPSLPPKWKARCKN